jgi:glutathione S-transferase
MSWPTIDLYHGMASTCSKKVRMCLYEKGIPFVSHLLDLQKFEQHTPEYLAINPRGVVPSIVHDGKSIIESSIIIDYLDDCFGWKPLKPKDPYELCQMRLWVKYSDDVGYKAVYIPTWHRLRHRAQEGLKGDTVTETLSRVPTAERRDRWEKISQGGYTEAELEAAYELMLECLANAEKQLQSTPWLAGEQFTLADIAMLPFIDRIANLRPEFLDRSECEAIRDWLSRVRQRPSFDQAFNFKDDPRASELPNF